LALLSPSSQSELEKLQKIKEERDAMDKKKEKQLRLEAPGQTKQTKPLKPKKPANNEESDVPLHLSTDKQNVSQHPSSDDEKKDQVILSPRKRRFDFQRQPSV
jgi:hypothetical protein